MKSKIYKKPKISLRKIKINLFFTYSDQYIDDSLLANCCGTSVSAGESCSFAGCGSGTCTLDPLSGSYQCS